MSFHFLSFFFLFLKNAFLFNNECRVLILSIFFGLGFTKREMAESERTRAPWTEAEQRPVAMAEIHSHELSMSESVVAAARDGAVLSAVQPAGLNNASDGKLGFAERALSAAGAAFLSAIIVNPLDVAKVTFFFF